MNEKAIETGICGVFDFLPACIGGAGVGGGGGNGAERIENADVPDGFIPGVFFPDHHPGRDRAPRMLRRKLP